MKNDFEMIEHSFKNEIYIVPIADVHYGSTGFNEKLWKRTKQFILDNDNVYCVFLGDIIDNQTKNSHDPFGNTIRPLMQKEWYEQQVTDLKDKILCGTSGNHTRKKDNIASDDDIDYNIFKIAGIKDLYRPNLCILKVKIGDRSDYGRQTYLFSITHGSGGGTNVGSNANKQEKASKIFSGVDCIITGHTHKPINFPTSVIEVDSKNNKVSEKVIQVIVSPSYLNYGGYALRGQLTPAPYEDIIIKLTKRKNKKIIKINDYDLIKEN